MKIRTFLLSISTVLLLTNLLFSSQDKKTYLDLLNQGKFDKLQKHIQAWEKRSPKDPDMYIAWYNYYINRNLVSGIGMNQENGQHTIGPRNSFDHDDVIKGITFLDEALKLYPDRLDIYLGKITSLEQIQELGLMGDTLISFLAQSISNKGHWINKDNKEQLDDAHNVLEMVQEKIYALFQMDHPDTLRVALKVSQAMLIYYPGHVYGYNNCGGIYSYKKDYKEALKYFLKGREIDRDDEYVVLNIGICYFYLKDYSQSKMFLNKVIESSESQIRNTAKHFLSEIKKDS